MASASDRWARASLICRALEALSALCRRDASFAELIRAVAPTWLLQLPWLSTPEERDALRRDLSGSGQARMLREFGELLERYTEERPLLLVTEDLHWSDAATLQLMDHIARRRGAARLLWLASFRLTEVMAADHPLKSLRHELRLHGLSEEIVLDAFSETEVADYVAAKLPGLAAEETFVQALHARTEGLPLFVADVVSDLMTHGDVTHDSESSARSRLESMPVPENLAGIIEQYMQRLTPEERMLLEAASVCGVEFRLNTLAEVLESDIASSRAVVRRARARAALARSMCRSKLAGSTSDTRYAFRHALYREVLHNRIGPVARAELHRKIAARAGARACRRRGRYRGGACLAFRARSRTDCRHCATTPKLPSSLCCNSVPVETMRLTQRALALLPCGGRASDARSLEITLATLRGAAAIQLYGISSDRGEGRVRAARSRCSRTCRTILCVGCFSQRARYSHST